MSDKPFVNQQAWGRSLLDRLSKSLDEDGGLHIWDELPTESMDGSPLGESDAGLGGILKGTQSSYHQWDGSQWQQVFRIPISFQGEPIETRTADDSGSTHSILNPGERFDHIFTVSSQSGTGFLFLRKFNKKTGQREWESTYTLDSGYQRVIAGGGNKGFCVAQNKIFVFTSSTPSFTDLTNPILNIYCFSYETGTFQWKTTISAVASASILALRINTDSLYVFRIGELLKINPASGVVDATMDLSGTTGANNVGEIFLPSSSQVVLVSSFSAAVSLTVVSGAADEVLFNTSLSGGSFSSVSTNNWIQDPLNQNLIYFEETGYVAPSRNKIWRYNASDNSFSVAALFLADERFVGSLASILKDGDFYYFYCIKGGSLVVYSSRLDGTDIIFFGVRFPGGEGGIATPRNPFLLSQDFIVTKNTQKTFGYGITFKTERTLYFSGSNKQIVYWNDAAFSSSGDLTDLPSSSNFKDIFATSISTKNIVSNQVSAGSSRGHSDGPIVDAPSNDWAFAAGGIRIFSLYNFLGGLSAESIGYTGAHAGGFCSGIGFNATPVAGRLLTTGNHNSSQHSGIILFDAALGRLMFEVKNTGASRDALISGFPAANPGLCLNATGLGVKLFSPAHPVDVGGTLRATTLMNSGGTVTSDERIKVGILPLDGLSLWEIWTELEAISFLYKPDFSFVVREVSMDQDGSEVVTEIPQKWPLPQGIQYGWSAQRVQEYLPELVTEDPQSGVLYLNREALFPIFQSASTAKILQLEEEIAQKDTILTQLQTAIESLTARVEALENAAA